MFYTFIDTPVGKVLLIGDGQVLAGLHWDVFARRPQVANTWIEDKTRFTVVIQQIEEYFAGTRKSFDITYQMRGTPLQQSVWKELEKIPYGIKSSYQAIATAIGKPAAVRAVGAAVGSNPISIIVPCHRVLTSASKISGFAGGVPSKMRFYGVKALHSSRSYQLMIIRVR
jgi:methylated-DNA-[protein]-cysteine S-methyltransferase